MKGILSKYPGSDPSSWPTSEEGGEGKVKIWRKTFSFGALKRPLNGSRTLEMDSNQLGGPFGAMLSCCDVVMSCFNLHLALSKAFALHRNPREVHGRPKFA